MSKKKGKWLAIVLVVAMVLSLIPAMGGAVDNDYTREGTTKKHSDFKIMSPGLSTTDLSDPDLDAADLVEFLLADDPGIDIDDGSIVYTGAEVAAGIFSGGDGIIGFEKGIILSTGKIKDVVGPNEYSGTSTSHGTDGDKDLADLIGVDVDNTNDAAVLEFEFVTDSDMVYFRYVFASEEYNEYVGSDFNDVFAFFVNGENYALIEGDTPVSINNVNHGNDDYQGDRIPPSNPDYYINNDPHDPDYWGDKVHEKDLLDTEMDGLTVVLTLEAPVAPNEINTMKLAIADVNDSVWDSNVFIEAGTFGIEEPAPPPPPPVGTEVLYLIDSQQEGNSSVIFTVDLVNYESNDFRAELTEVTTIPYYNVDALACVPDDPDHILFGVNKNGAQLWSYNVATGVYTDIGVVNDPDANNPIPDIVLAAFSPDGTLFVACQNTNNLYSVSLDGSDVVNYGHLKENGSTVNLHGADFAFDSDGNLFLWTNRPADAQGLWKVDADDVEVGNLAATKLGGFDRFFTGLAFREDGLGDLVGSETTSDTIAELDKDDGSLIQDYVMYLDGDIYEYTYGDMTSGPLAPPEELTVTKTVETYYEREHEWEINKWVETEEGHTIGEDKDSKIWLYVDGSGDETATWYVDVTYLGYEDNDFNVSGEIAIENTGEVDAEITGVVDELAGEEIDIVWMDEDGEALDPQPEFPYTLEPGETLKGTYDEDLDEAVAGDNVVTVTTEEDEYTTEEEIVWSEEPDDEFYAEITVEDVSDLFGTEELGTLDAADSEEESFGEFSYDKEFAWEDYEEGGSYTYENTSTIVETEQSASAVLKVNVQDYDDETAYAKGDNATCFIPTFSNWGWTNPIKPGTYEWDLWAGAAQCDTSKGMLVGSVDVDYCDEGNVTVEFNVDDDYIIIETHVYAGEDKFPQQQRGRRMVDTVAPGQYYNDSPFSVVGDNGELPEVYVIAHAVVRIPDPDFGPAE